MDGLVVLLNMAGNSIAAQQQVIEALQQQVASLQAELAAKDTIEDE